MHNLAEYIVSLFEKKGIISSSSHELYVYGFSQLIYTFISTTALILIGLFFHRPLETIVLISLFYTNQTVGGGFHANSHLTCFLCMSVGLLIYLLSFRFPCSQGTLTFLFVVSFLALFLRPLVLHKNKLFLAEQSAKFIKKSRLALWVELLVFVLFFILQKPSLIHAFSLSMVLSSCSRIAAILIGLGKSFIS